MSGIRPAVPQDRASIVDVAQLSGLFPPDEVAEIEGMVDAFFAGDTDGDRWIVDSDGHRVTAIAYYAPERMTNGTWNLYLLAVHPHQRGSGHGAALVRHVEQDLIAAGARVLLIETSGTPEFTGQRSFYFRLGYHEEARIREFYAPGDDKIVYWKSLLPAQERYSGLT